MSFPDQSDDMLLLNKVHKEDTVFQGSLYNEGSRVCVVIEDPSNPDNIVVKNLIFSIKFSNFS